jgi:Tfp pilus assembly protein PilF
MKMIQIFFIKVIIVFLLFSCGGNDKQKARDMITTRTMGLAYIEENKLPEAENAFKQLITIAPHEALGFANLGLVYIRMGNYQEAELRLREALAIEPNDPEIQLNLAEVYILTNRKREAIQLLEKTLNHHPDHIRTMYKLGQNYSRSDTLVIRLKGEKLLKEVVEFLPANITARLELVDLLLRNNNANDAFGYFDDLKRQMPEYPDEANQFYDTSLSYMRQENAMEAQSPFNIFRNIIKPTPLFRAGFDELTGMSGPLIGTPVVTFRKDLGLSSQSDQLAFETLRFTDVTSEAGLDMLPKLNINSNQMDSFYYTLAVADVDGNGTQDLYVSGWDGKNIRFLMLNNFGKYKDIISESGISHQGRDRQAIFTDYDNDGYLDLYLVNDQKNLLYYHYEPKKFRNMASSAGVTGNRLGIAAAFADLDHDGDLDLYQANSGKNQFFRNNLDGTFTENSIRMGIAGDDTPSGEIVFGDFDDDGDLDFFVLNKNTENILYSNLRQGQFANITTESGLTHPEGSKAVALGDYNNDGRVDLCILPNSDDSFHLYKNMDGKKFEIDKRSDEMESKLDSITCLDAEFLDFDNDGYLDLVVAGEPEVINQKRRGIFLFHNNGKGVFKDASYLLPDDLPSFSQIVTADYNEDGDLDLILSGKDGKVYLLRNDGGNANHYLKVQLVGLRTGSGKNNYFGIGAKVEVKSGELYQSVFVSKPISHFGLGSRTKADIVRVLWTNGVPQNLFEPGSDQALLEKQILKGSCPFLYAWNGERYEFVTDVLWRSALGMPLGIMGGETAYAFADPSEDYFKIPGELLREKNGRYSLQLTAELWETAYFDQVQLLVIDHPGSSDIFVDERFTPPPFPPLQIHQVGQRHYPKSVQDDRGNELKELIREKDNVYISNLIADRYQGITKPHDLIIDLGAVTEKDKIVLYLNGWLFPTDASINLAISQSSQTSVLPPQLQVKNKSGEWQIVIDNVSFPMGKNKYIILDLTDKFLSDDYRVRIRTTMQIYWDYIFFTTGKMDIPMNVQTLQPISADLHYRGFSRMYRKGGKYGPFWFDYNEVSTEPIWRDLVGYYTRYGDVRELLLEPDGKYIISNAGDEITLEFDAISVPDLKSGWKRDFIIYTNGWLKDGDLNTACGQTVEPLPIKGMSRYPYSSEESYPDKKEYRDYLKKYNTRKVSTDRLSNRLK